jgi:hypothetical protein
MTVNVIDGACSIWRPDSVQGTLSKRWRAPLAGRSDGVLVWNPCHKGTLPQHMSCTSWRPGFNPSVDQEAVLLVL